METDLTLVGLNSNHVRNTVELRLERSNSVFQGYEFTWHTGKYFSHSERLRHELLYLTCASNGKLVIFRQFIHTQNGNNILKTLQVLQQLLGSTGNIVMFLADDARIQHTGVGVQRIDSRVDTQFRNSTRQHSISVKMRKGGSRSRIGKIISRYVNSLYRGNRTLLGRGNTFLKGTKIGSKGRLVTDSRRDTSQQSGYPM